MAKNSNLREKFTYNVVLPFLGFIILALMLYMGSSIVDFFKTVPDFKNFSSLEISERNVIFFLLLTGMISAVITDLILVKIYINYRKFNRIGACK